VKATDLAYALWKTLDHLAKQAGLLTLIHKPAERRYGQAIPKPRRQEMRESMERILEERKESGIHQKQSTLRHAGTGKITRKTFKGQGTHHTPRTRLCHGKPVRCRG
jgi:hypothetical protein